MRDSPTVMTLAPFRTALYTCFTQRRDALIELADALLTGSPVPAPIHLSLEPVHRRGWGSLYAALARGRIDAAALQTLIARTTPAARPAPPVYAIDMSAWPRCDAETSSDRGYYY